MIEHLAPITALAILSGSLAGSALAWGRGRRLRRGVPYDLNPRARQGRPVDRPTFKPAPEPLGKMHRERMKRRTWKTIHADGVKRTRGRNRGEGE